MGTEILPPLPLSWVQTPPPLPPRHLKIRLVRPSLTFLGHHALLIWKDWYCIYRCLFSNITLFEKCNHPTPLSTKLPP